MHTPRICHLDGLPLATNQRFYVCVAIRFLNQARVWIWLCLGRTVMPPFWLWQCSFILLFLVDVFPKLSTYPRLIRFENRWVSSPWVSSSRSEIYIFLIGVLPVPYTPDQIFLTKGPQRTTSRWPRQWQLDVVVADRVLPTLWTGRVANWRSLGTSAYHLSFLWCAGQSTSHSKTRDDTNISVANMILRNLNGGIHIYLKDVSLWQPPVLSEQGYKEL